MGCSLRRAEWLGKADGELASPLSSVPLCTTGEEGTSRKTGSPGRGTTPSSVRVVRSRAISSPATAATILAAIRAPRCRLFLGTSAGTTGGTSAAGSSTPFSLSLSAASQAPGAALTLFLSPLSIAPAFPLVSSWHDNTVTQSFAPRSPASRLSPCASVPRWHIG